MPRKGRNMPKRSQEPPGARIEKIAGRTLFSAAIPTGKIFSILNTTVFPRAAAVADVFQYYRFTKLNIEMKPVSATIAIGYANGAAFDTAPSTPSEVIALPFSKLMVSGQTISEHLNIPRAELLKDTQLKWYKTIDGTPEAGFETQGNVYVGFTGGGTASINLVIDYEVEFQSWNLANNSPLRALTAVPVGTPSQELNPESERPRVLYLNGGVYKLDAK